MAGREILVTGANGFIGTNLVRRLVQTGHRVTCLIRSKSKMETLRGLGVNFIIGDVADVAALKEAVAEKTGVFHLAGTVNFASPAETMKTNAGGTENLLHACSLLQNPPTFIYVSSIAAVGPSPRRSPHQETVLPRPVSNYGLSKAEGERIAKTFSDRVPISIVRPPIVLGANDPHSMQLFQLIDRWRLHFIAGYVPQDFSTIHVDDLVDALMAVAKRGKRLMSDSIDQGVYFAAADEILSFGQLGRLMGQALGKSWILRVPTPRFSISLTGAVNSTINNLFRTRLFLTYDKAREATAGSWACRNDKLKGETGWAPGAPLLTRLEQTVAQFKHQSLPLPQPDP